MKALGGCEGLYRMLGCWLGLQICVSIKGNCSSTHEEKQMHTKDLQCKYHSQIL